MNINVSGFINPAFIGLYSQWPRYLLIYGGAGSGKSHFAAQKIVLRCLQEPGHRILVLRKVARTLRESCFALTIEILVSFGIVHHCKINYSEEKITFWNGSKIIFAGLDDAAKMKSIHRITSIWVEEATEFSQKDFNQVDIRMRGKTLYPKQIILTFNPIDIFHWIKTRFFDRTVDSCFIHHSTYKDNLHLSKEDGAVLESYKDIDEAFYTIYAKGQWATPQNLIYSNWVVSKTWPENFKERIYGIDWGFNHPTAVIEIRFTDSMIYEDEVLYKTGLDTNQILKALDDLKVDKRACWYADSAEVDRINQFKLAGYNIYPANKDVFAGITYVKGLGDIHVRHSAQNIINEKKVYKWREDKDGRVLDEPVKLFDDAMDAERYAQFTHFMMWSSSGLEVKGTGDQESKPMLDRFKTKDETSVMLRRFMKRK